MLISDESINNLACIITGAQGISPIRKEADIISFLSQYVSSESFEEFFSAQDNVPDDDLEKSTLYVESKIKAICGTGKLTKLTEAIFNSPAFFHDKHNPENKYFLDENLTSFNTCMSWKNRFGIVRDNYTVTKAQKKYHVYGLNDCMVDYACLFKESEIGNYALINGHMKKCIKKINENDYSGAITSARTLLEQILREIELKLNPDAGAYNGDLPQLEKRVRSLVGLKNTDLPRELQNVYPKILAGMHNCVQGISSMRNCMGDAHPIIHPPGKKDALLAINASKTVANFIVEHYFDKFVKAA